MIHRLLSIPLLPSEFLAEVNTIKSLAHTNNISIDADKIIRKKLISRSLDLSTTLPRFQSSKQMGSPPLCRQLSFQLSHFLKSLGLSPAFNPINTLKKFVFLSHKSYSSKRKIRCYSIQCDSCPPVYVGQTGRSLKSRLNIPTSFLRIIPKDPLLQHTLSSGQGKRKGKVES